MTFLVRLIVDLFNGLASWYYRRKYGAAARQLGREPHVEDGRKGYVILELDGVSHASLLSALEQGTMPYLARMISRHRLALARWRCLPSTTPASQAGILYGNNWDIPGFRWYDKATRDPIQCKNVVEVRALQDRISEGRVGLLRGGSSYTNMFDGGARLALFTLSAVGQDRLFASVRGLGFLVLWALSPLRVLKVVALSLWTWAVYVARRAASVIAPSLPEFTFWGPLNQIFNNIIFREVTTLSVMVDIYRGMPAIYAAYTGYDEITHHFGAEGKEAARALRGLDRQVAQIDRIRQVYKRRDYDLYVLSDHGMTPSVPFRRAYGQTLQRLIADRTGQRVRGDEVGREMGEQTEARVQSLLDELQGLEAPPRRPISSALLRSARQRLEQWLAEAATSRVGWDFGRESDIVVQCSGPLAHVYFNVARYAMELSEVTALYPSLVEALVEHAGIGLVVGREGTEVVALGRCGTLWIGADGHRLVGDNPVTNYDDLDWAAEQLARLASFPHAGDLILFGAWDGHQVTSFEDQVATHGGLGGPQAWPFVAFSSGRRFSAHGIGNAEEVYSRLAQAYALLDPKPTTAPEAAGP